MFTRQVSVEVEIEAPAEKVWSILVDLEQYPAWNSFTPTVESTLVQGDGVKLIVAMFGKGRKPLVEKLRILAHRPGKQLDWGKVMGAAWLLRTCRTQRVDEITQGRCRYHTTDTFFGLLSPLVTAFFGRRIQNGFGSLAAGLKARAETADHNDL